MGSVWMVGFLRLYLDVGIGGGRGEGGGAMNWIGLEYQFTKETELGLSSNSVVWLFIELAMEFKELYKIRKVPSYFGTISHAV